MGADSLPGRRGVLLGAAGAAVVFTAGCGLRKDPEPLAPQPNQLITYADDHPDQHGYLGLPDHGRPKALAVVIHGGFWYQGFGADLMEPAAANLRSRGLATWNIEYRRTGAGGGWPATFVDVAKALDHVPALPLPLDLPVVVLGHSAGGHLAVWAASRTAHTPGGASKVTAERTYSLSGVLNLTRADRERLGNGAATFLMGGSAAQFRERYDLGDPSRLVPARGPVTVFHADQDEFVPLSQSTSYIAADRAAGGHAELVRVPGGHLQMVQPQQPGWQAVRDVVLSDLD